MGFLPKTFFKLCFCGFLGSALVPPAVAQTINIVAGNCTGAYAGDGGPATQASLWLPEDIAFDGAGNYYIADAGSNTIRKVNAATGIISTYAGVPNEAGVTSSGNGGEAVSAVFDYTSGVAFDSSNNLYIADYYYGEVRKVTASTGIITAFAGNGTSGSTGDGGPATLAQMRNPVVDRFDPTGRYLAISDPTSNNVREVDTTTGFITTVAGNGTAGYSGDGKPATLAELNQPDGLAFDASGNLYIADNMNGAVRKVTAATGIISTVAGTGVTGYSGDNQPATLAQLGNDIGGLAFNCDGNLLIADGHNYRVRMVDKNTGFITTVAGNGLNSATCSTSDTPVLSTQINLPQALAFDPAGNLYIVDYGYDLVQEVPGGFCPPTPTPTPPAPASDCDTIQTYSYPDPPTESPMNILYVLCEAGEVKIQVYNSAAQLVASYDTSGSPGTNVYPANITGFSHGVYYYLVISNDSSGEKKSKPKKFAVTKSL